jgi:hypothetical protein
VSSEVPPRIVLNRRGEVKENKVWRVVPRVPARGTPGRCLCRGRTKENRRGRLLAFGTASAIEYFRLA